MFLSFLFPFFLHKLIELLNYLVGDMFRTARVSGCGVGAKEGMLELFVRKVALYFCGGEFRLNEISLADLAKHILSEDEADTCGVIGIIPWVRIFHTVFAPSAARTFLEDEIALVLALDALALDSELFGNALDDLVKIFRYRLRNAISYPCNPLAHFAVKHLL